MIGRASGLIVDTPSTFGTGTSATDHRHKLIKACVEALKSTAPNRLSVWILTLNHNLSVNTVVVVGQEKLYIEMQRTYSSQLAVVKVPKSGGVSLRRLIAFP